MKSIGAYIFWSVLASRAFDITALPVNRATLLWSIAVSTNATLAMAAAASGTCARTNEPFLFSAAFNCYKGAGLPVSKHATSWTQWLTAVRLTLLRFNRIESIDRAADSTQANGTMSGEHRHSFSSLVHLFRSNSNVEERVSMAAGDWHEQNEWDTRRRGRGESRIIHRCVFLAGIARAYKYSMLNLDCKEVSESTLKPQQLLKLSSPFWFFRRLSTAPPCRSAKNKRKWV
jgi:hypothetical protein